MNRRSGWACLHRGDQRRPVVRRPARAPARSPTCGRTPRWSSASPCRSGARRTGRRSSISVSATAVAQRGREGVQLHHVRPRREVRVAAVRDDAAVGAQERLRVLRELGRRVPRRKQSGRARRARDGRARRGSARSRGSARARGGELLAGGRRAVRPAEPLVDDVVGARSTASRSRPRGAGPAARPGTPASSAGSAQRDRADPPGCAPRPPSARPRRPGARPARPRRRRGPRRGERPAALAARSLQPRPRC